MQQNEKTSLDDLPSEMYMVNAVHEIRTPVQTIIGTLDLLSDTHLTPEQTEYVRQIRFGSDVLLTLVNDMLDFSKIRSQKMQLETVPYDVKTISENVVHLISIEAYNKDIEIVTDIDYSLPDKVLGDPIRVQQILLNLLKNAVKFTTEGYIHLSLSQEENELLFKVTDSGIGIPDEKQDSLFESFFQADSSITRKYGGTGLGLAICKELVTKMNGSIGVKANPYGGSCFWFKIPLVLTDESSLQTAYEIPDAEKFEILIVDDSSLAAKSFTRQLESLGIKNVTYAADGNDALLKIRYRNQIGKPFDFIFIDMIMPIMDGWHLASELRNTGDKGSSKLFLLVPEGQMGKDAKMKVLDWFDGYLYKPIHREKLDALLLKCSTQNNPSKNPVELDSANSETEKMLVPGVKILVAEDHPVNRQILVRFLEKFGAKVFEAENGKEAIAQIGVHPEIEMIFMDIMMPGMSGSEATVTLRKKGYTGIIIACTAYAEQYNFSMYQDIGMNDIVVKPFKRTDVMALLEKWNTVLQLPSANSLVAVEATPVISDEMWDIQDFEDTIGKDWDLGNQIILDYIDQTRHFLTASKDLLENADFEELHRVAHTLKGSSAAISANKLTNISASFSQATKDKDIHAVAQRLKEFEEQFELFILLSKKWDHKC